ncbi:MAG TPA: flagellar protein FliS [Bacillota bacterium]|nr:flagellar protein FliS [Bacillota bacterium]
MKRRLVEANIKKDSAIIGEVVDLISNLRETWQEAMKTGQGSNG